MATNGGRALWSQAPDGTDVLAAARVRGPIGHGSNAAVVCATFNAGDVPARYADAIPVRRKLAIKLMSHFWDNHAKTLLDCERATLAALPPHPNIIRVYAEFPASLPLALRPHVTEDMRIAAEADDAHSTQVFLMEFHPTTLDAYRALFPLPLPWPVLHRVARDLVAAVTHLEAHNTVHLDVKLDNVLVAYDGRCVLTDFGIAHAFRPGDGMRLPYREPLELLMNRLVLAPEVLEAHDTAKAAARAKRRSARTPRAARLRGGLAGGGGTPTGGAVVGDAGGGRGGSGFPGAYRRGIGAGGGGSGVAATAGVRAVATPPVDSGVRRAPLASGAADDAAAATTTASGASAATSPVPASLSSAGGSGANVHAAPTTPGAASAAGAATAATAPPTAAAPPGTRTIDMPFAAQGIWSVGTILYELAAGFSHQPAYPESGLHYSTAAVPPLPAAAARAWGGCGSSDSGAPGTVPATPIAPNSSGSQPATLTGEASRGAASDGTAPRGGNASAALRGTVAGQPLASPVATSTSSLSLSSVSIGGGGGGGGVGAGGSGSDRRLEAPGAPAPPPPPPGRPPLSRVRRCAGAGFRFDHPGGYPPEFCALVLAMVDAVPARRPRSVDALAALDALQPAIVYRGVVVPGAAAAAVAATVDGSGDCDVHEAATAASLPTTTVNGAGVLDGSVVAPHISPDGPAAVGEMSGGTGGRAPHDAAGGSAAAPDSVHLGDFPSVMPTGAVLPLLSDDGCVFPGEDGVGYLADAAPVDAADGSDGDEYVPVVLRCVRVVEPAGTPPSTPAAALGAADEPAPVDAAARSESIVDLRRPAAARTGAHSVVLVMRVMRCHGSLTVQQALDAWTLAVPLRWALPRAPRRLSAPPGSGALFHDIGDSAIPGSGGRSAYSVTGGGVRAPAAVEEGPLPPPPPQAAGTAAAGHRHGVGRIGWEDADEVGDGAALTDSPVAPGDEPIDADCRVYLGGCELTKIARLDAAAQYLKAAVTATGREADAVLAGRGATAVARTALSADATASVSPRGSRHSPRGAASAGTAPPGAFALRTALVLDVMLPERSVVAASAAFLLREADNVLAAAAAEATAACRDGGGGALLVVPHTDALPDVVGPTATEPLLADGATMAVAATAAAAIAAAAGKRRTADHAALPVLPNGRVTARNSGDATAAVVDPDAASRVAAGDAGQVMLSRLCMYEQVALSRPPTRAAPPAVPSGATTGTVSGLPASAVASGGVDGGGSAFPVGRSAASGPASGPASGAAVTVPAVAAARSTVVVTGGAGVAAGTGAGVTFPQSESVEELAAPLTLDAEESPAPPPPPPAPTGDDAATDEDSMTEAVLLRCALALTALANAGLREESAQPTDGAAAATLPGADSDAPAESSRTPSFFPFERAASVAVAATERCGSRHEAVAAAVGLLRNLSCTHDSGTAAALVRTGAVRAALAAFSADWPLPAPPPRGALPLLSPTFAGDGGGPPVASPPPPQAPPPASAHGHGGVAGAAAQSRRRVHGDDPRVAEDALLAAANLLRFDEQQTEAQPWRAAADAIRAVVAAASSVTGGLAAAAAATAAAAAATAAGGTAPTAVVAGSPPPPPLLPQPVFDAAVRLLRYVSAIPSGAVALALAQAGGVRLCAAAVAAWPGDRAMLEMALHVICALLVYEAVRVTAWVPVADAASAVVAAMGREDMLDDAGIQGLGATVLRNLACVVVDSSGAGGGGSEPVASLAAGAAAPSAVAAAADDATAAAAAAAFAASPAMTVTRAGAPAVLEAAMERHAGVASVQDNARCALYNLLLIGMAEAEAVATRADVLAGRVAELRRLAAASAADAVAARAEAVAATRAPAQSPLRVTAGASSPWRAGVSAGSTAASPAATAAAAPGAAPLRQWADLAPSQQQRAWAAEADGVQDRVSFAPTYATPATPGRGGAHAPDVPGGTAATSRSSLRSAAADEVWGGESDGTDGGARQRQQRQQRPSPGVAAAATERRRSPSSVAVALNAEAEAEARSPQLTAAGGDHGVTSAHSSALYLLVTDEPARGANHLRAPLSPPAPPPPPTVTSRDRLPPGAMAAADLLLAEPDVETGAGHLAEPSTFAALHAPAPVGASVQPGVVLEAAPWLRRHAVAIVTTLTTLLLAAIAAVIALAATR